MHARKVNSYETALGNYNFALKLGGKPAGEQPQQPRLLDTVQFVLQSYEE